MVKIRHGLKLLAAGLLILGSVSIVRTTAAQGTDFEVFWRAARYVLNGQPLYSTARDGVMIFKYPPWVLPFFLPFGALPLTIAKWLWGVIELGSLVFVLRWLVFRAEVQKPVLFLVLCLYWGLWIVHSLDGQVVLPMLALALALWPVPPKSMMRFFGLSLTLSAKIFTLFPLLNTPWRKSWLPYLFGFLVLCGLLSIPAWWVQPSQSWVDLFAQWKQAATSSSQLMSEAQVRGRLNPSLPGFLLSHLRVPVSNSSADVLFALFSAFISGLTWHRISRWFDPLDQWLGWLALTPLIHPLPWWHLFIFTFPLAAVVLDRSIRCKRKDLVLFSLAGIFLIGVATAKVFGSLGQFFEQNAAKLWGTLVCLGVLVRLNRSKGSTLAAPAYHSATPTACP